MFAARSGRPRQERQAGPLSRVVLAHALLSPERLDLQAVYAAPFRNDTTGPTTGMRQSYEEILRVLDRFGRGPGDFVFTGSERWLSDTGTPVPSAAADDLVARSQPKGPSI